ncbi:MAG: TetR/AcrR family transcriptional regulator [Gammaproteobacteria bacterium]|nr:TetR/AcrR family transcriptional regulator [Gammaproteobacteria bacterium]
MPAGETGKYEQQRHAAIRAAASVFAEKGFHGSSTRDIAERMGIKQGSLYYYFKSKEEALSEVCLYGMQDYAGRMVSIAASEQPFRAKLTATITSHITKYREKNEALKVYNAERLYLDESKRTRLHELGSGYRQQLEGIFVEGQKSGEVRADVDCRFASHAVIGICNSWGEQIVRDPDMDIYEIIDNSVGLILNGFSNNKHTN